MLKGRSIHISPPHMGRASFQGSRISQSQGLAVDGKLFLQGPGRRKFNTTCPSRATPFLHIRHVPQSLLLRCHQRRSISLITILTPPAAFLGLLTVLWLYKSLILIIFQNKIIYMPSVPPFSRSEKISDYASLCRPIVWREERIEAADSTGLALAVGEISNEASATALDTASGEENAGSRRRVVILYFQGNGASTPPRLPVLSTVLRALNTHPSTPFSSPSSSNIHTTYTLSVLSYRGFWTSRGRPMEAGLNLDASAALSWAYRTFPSTESEEVKIVLWGQSLGAAVAVGVLLTLLLSDRGTQARIARG